MSGELIEEHTVDGKTLSIYRDYNAPNPRSVHDNICMIVCWDTRYRLGDKHHFKTKDLFVDWYVENNTKCRIIKPVYMVDHSGISLSLDSRVREMHPWDTSIIGYIFPVDKKVEEFGLDPERDKERIESALQSELETYDQFLNNDVYRYELTKGTICECCGHVSSEPIDSCIGFYGSDFVKNGLYESAGFRRIDETDSFVCI